MVTSQGIPGLGTSFHILLPHCANKPDEHHPSSPVVTQVNGIVSSVPNINILDKSSDKPKANGGHVALCVDDDPINQVFNM